VRWAETMHWMRVSILQSEGMTGNRCEDLADEICVSDVLITVFDIEIDL
jgi:hypothetical protein